MDPKENFFAQVAEGLQRRQAERIAAEEAKLSEQEVAKSFEIARSLEIARVYDRIDRLDARPPSKLAIVAIVADRRKPEIRDFYETDMCAGESRWLEEFEARQSARASGVIP